MKAPAKKADDLNKYWFSICFARIVQLFGRKLINYFFLDLHGCGATVAYALLPAFDQIMNLIIWVHIWAPLFTKFKNNEVHASFVSYSRFIRPISVVNSHTPVRNCCAPYWSLTISLNNEPLLGDYHTSQKSLPLMVKWVQIGLKKSTECRMTVEFFCGCYKVFSTLVCIKKTLHKPVSADLLTPKCIRLMIFEKAANYLYDLKGRWAG